MKILFDKQDVRIIKKSSSKYASNSSSKESNIVKAIVYLCIRNNPCGFHNLNLLPE